ncbi:helix-turn-helix transcriptional regulator [Alloalcanivorax xenomutans]|jgi:AraC-like DNA-binding protein|uniref:helix-turn-helix transcriptional regulator n=1 Tax=Alloalcanivorax xenomutans TaxID=1094342 RepID=UPI0003B84F2A|nr:hypothetical protein Q668_10600 [Alcanivorax sp. PN-3]
MGNLQETSITCPDIGDKAMESWVSQYFRGIYDIKRFDKGNSPSLYFEDYGFRIFSFTLGRRTVSGKLSGERDEAYIQENPSDIINFAVIKKGSLTLSEKVEHGRIYYIDYRQPTKFHSSAGYVEYGLALSASTLIKICGRDPAMISGKMVNNEMSLLLSNFIVFLAESLRDMKEEDLPNIYGAIQNMIRAFISPSKDALEIARPQIMVTQAAQIRAYIEAGIQDPKMSISSITQHFGISRRTLYRLFRSDQDGIGAYITRCRLRSALIDIELARTSYTSTPKSPFSIKALAYRYGFSDTSSFGRAFKKQYGVTPRDAFEDPNIIAKKPPLNDDPPFFRDLIDSLR